MRNEIKNVLAYVDFSTASLNAVNTAIKICQRHGAILSLLYVREPDYNYPTAGLQAPLASLALEMSKAHEENLDNFAASIKRNCNIECSGIFEPGFTVKTICDKAVNTVTDIIVIGTSPKPLGKQLFLGNIAHKIIKEVTCPVLTVPCSRRVDKFKQILFPVRPVLNAIGKYQFLKPIISRNEAAVHIVGAAGQARQMTIVENFVKEIKKIFHMDKVTFSSELHLNKNISDQVLNAGRQISADLVVVTAAAQKGVSNFFRSDYVKKMMNNHEFAMLYVKPQTGSDTRRLFADFIHA